MSSYYHQKVIKMNFEDKQIIPKGKRNVKQILGILKF